MIWFQHLFVYNARIFFHLLCLCLSIHFVPFRFFYSNERDCGKVSVVTVGDWFSWVRWLWNNLNDAVALRCGQTWSDQGGRFWNNCGGIVAHFCGSKPFPRRLYSGWYNMFLYLLLLSKSDMQIPEIRVFLSHSEPNSSRRDGKIPNKLV